MIFSSFEFIFLFFPAVLIFYFLTANFGKNISILILIIFSFIFYYIAAKEWLPLIICSLIFNSLISFFVKQKKILFFAIIINLLIIFVYKYNVIGLSISNYSFENIIIPLGISFYTFNQIVFLLDIYNNKITKPKIRYFTFLIIFFPHLIAGPFLRYNNIIDQFKNKFKMPFSKEKIKFGLFIFIIGLGKKIIIADSLGIYVDALHYSLKLGHLPTFFQSWLGTVSFSLQLYFDFSGYSDMAIGLALILGIVLPINFNSPFKTTNIIEFWSRWHMTLTNLIREFIFFPLTVTLGRNLSLNDKLKSNFYLIIIPTLITFAIIGMWHGGTINFLLFGIYNGILIVVYQIFLKKKNHSEVKNNSNFLMIMINFVFINFGFIFFRSENFSSSLNLIKGLFGFNGLGIPYTLAEKFTLLKIFKIDAIHLSYGLSSIYYLVFIFIGLMICFATKNYNFSKFFLNDKYKFNFTNYDLIKIYFIFIFSILFLDRNVSFLYFNF